jgi:hypothetical protein
VTFQSLPYDPRPLTATEARLEAIYAAAKLGLKGDSLALAAGMTPVEYRKLCQMDPIAEYAEQKGRADGERAMATTLYAAAEAGDAKAATEMLRYAHGWVAKQAVEVSIEQKISITAALEEAQRRVLDLSVDYATNADADGVPARTGILTNQPDAKADSYGYSNARRTEKSTGL